VTGYRVEKFPELTESVTGASGMSQPSALVINTYHYFSMTGSQPADSSRSTSTQILRDLSMYQSSCLITAAYHLSPMAARETKYESEDILTWGMFNSPPRSQLLTVIVPEQKAHPPRSNQAHVHQEPSTTTLLFPLSRWSLLI
jgi:hypothetical protein